MAKMDEHGRIQIVGREKDLVISGGLNIYPKEIEEAIDALDGVSETAIIGVPHADLGEGLVAVICPAAGFKIEPEAMITTLKPRLAGFKVPRKIFTVDRLPRNAMGKVQKKRATRKILRRFRSLNVIDYSSVYFFAIPRDFSTGYFCLLISSLSHAACSRSISSREASRTR